MKSRKTTLACNFAHYAASDLGLRVAVLDLDPQANATQLVLSDTQWESLYEDTSASDAKTVLKVFGSILEGDSSINEDVDIYQSDRFGVGVIAGHPSLSRVEDQLSGSWIELKGEQPGGARRTNWLSTLREALDFDLVVIDLGPSLGALNRSALLGSTHFITPVAADLFSLYALENIGEWAREWVSEYEDAMARTVKKNAGSKGLLSLPTSPAIKSGYLGFTIQQYVAKRTGGELRPTAAYDRYKALIPERAAVLKKFAAPAASDFALGIVPNMFSMIPLAQNVHAPIISLETRDGVRGAQVYQQARYAADLRAIFGKTASNMGIAK